MRGKKCSSVYFYNPDPNGENCILDRNLRANVYLLIFSLKSRLAHMRGARFPVEIEK